MLLSACVMQMGKTPLCVAVECCTVNVVESLIQLGASVNQPTEVSIVQYRHSLAKHCNIALYGLAGGA